jgi:hypothetical protein
VTCGNVVGVSMTIRSEYQRGDGQRAAVAVTVDGLDALPPEVGEQHVRLAAVALDAAIRAAHRTQQPAARHATGEQSQYSAPTQVIGAVR